MKLSESRLSLWLFPRKFFKAIISRFTRWTALRLLVTLALVYFLLRVAPLSEIQSSFKKIPATAFLIGVLLTGVNCFLGAVRWRVLFRIFGAKEVPNVFFLSRVNIVSTFYSTFLPANLGGDVLRGFVTRKGFESPWSGYVVLCVERGLGLGTCFLLGALALLVLPIHAFPSPLLFAGIGLLIVSAAILGPSILRFVLKLLEERRILKWRLPVSASIVPRYSLSPSSVFFNLVLAVIFSFGTLTVLSMAGHAMVSSVDSSVSLLHSIVLVPLSFIAQQFPATVAGVGAREVAFGFLYSKVGVTWANATAASIGFLGVQLIFSLLGGLVHLFFPFKEKESLAEAASAQTPGADANEARQIYEATEA